MEMRLSLSKYIVYPFILINLLLLFFTEKNILTWYLYISAAALLPLMQIVILTKEREKTRFYSINIIILYAVSIFFIFALLASIFLKDVLIILN